MDLAGAQHTRGTSGEFLDESRKINLGLSSMYRVLRGRVSWDKVMTRSGFRDSKLTKLMQPLFDGSSNTHMLFCMSAARGVLIPGFSDSLSVNSYLPRYSICSERSEMSWSESIDEKDVLKMVL